MTGATLPAPQPNEHGLTVIPVVRIRLSSNSHKLHIDLLRYPTRTMVGIREYREHVGGEWVAHKGGVNFDIQQLPTTIRSLLKAYEMSRGKGA